jgi:hypothetical protein
MGLGGISNKKREDMKGKINKFETNLSGIGPWSSSP